MLGVSFKRSLRRGLMNIFREEGWGTAVGSLFGVLLLGQVFLLLALGVEGGLTLLRERTDLRLEIRDTATDAQIQDLYQNIEELPYVEETVYITREQAYERQKTRDPELLKFLTTFGISNPFPDTMAVRLRHLNDYAAFVEFLQQPVFAPVVNPQFLSQTTDQEEQVERVRTVIAASRTMFLFAGVLVVGVLLFVVIELIRRRALTKREELFVEQLVGASPGQILSPFMVEMFFLLLVSLILSLIVTGFLLFLVPILLPALGTGGIFGEWSGVTIGLLFRSLPILLVLELFLIFCLSALGTFLALKAQLSLSLLRETLTA